MSRYRVMMHYSDGTSEMEDEIFETEEAAADHGSYMCACTEQGAEDLYGSNPGDYHLEDAVSADYEVIEVDD